MLAFNVVASQNIRGYTDHSHGYTQSTMSRIVVLANLTDFSSVQVLQSASIDNRIFSLHFSVEFSGFHDARRSAVERHPLYDLRPCK